jgi:proline iminopeptidase
VGEQYPAIEPHAAGLLPVGDGHQVYWETVGNAAGTPALWLHGGPGSGSGTGVRRYFDPAAYRAVLLDQRGCGRSIPLADSAAADLSANTTQRLIADVEALREHLAIDRWVVAGTSWGVALGLAYAQRHPERVRAMVLAAVTAGGRRETEWITRDMRRIFLREWDAFVAAVPEAGRDGDLAAAYATLLADADPAVTELAAQ